ncbi:uncharacterized protein [Parasteatoda tepidariorum]|uniref:uncharacterized protein n=1 Tax=Parasteatoda tepidariorum TaxID=114398 RepID=UPI00077FDA4F|nr:uncharacterized protein LOC107455080 [Parasteatoda tepidariorum]
MEVLFESAGPGVHCYSPFLKSQSKNITFSLEELCKNVILKCITLRRLATCVMELPLPKRLAQYITELTTMDFEQIECAPFCDIFSLNFFHRALTYRVMCLRDGQEYMISYGYSPVEDLKLIYSHEKWVQAQHKNIMCICATVKDLTTENVFYVYDQPYASLEQLWNVFCNRNQMIPDIFFIRLTTDVCEALRYILLQGLRYNCFGLDNIFVVHDRLVIENGLMRKKTIFLVNDNKRTCSEELNMIHDLSSVLKQLLESSNSKISQTNILKNILDALENHETISGVLQTMNSFETETNSFSFWQLTRSLLGSDY